MTELSNC